MGKTVGIGHIIDRLGSFGIRGQTHHASSIITLEVFLVYLFRKVTSLIRIFLLSHCY